MEEEHGELREITVFIEEEQIEAVDELARDLTKELNQQWDRGAVIRLALSEFFSKRGKII